MQTKINCTSFTPQKNKSKQPAFTSKGLSLSAKATPEASDFARFIGIKTVDFRAGTQYLANLVNSTMGHFASLNLPLPGEVLFRKTKPDCFVVPYGEFKMPSTLILYTEKNWLLSGILANFKAKQFSTDNPAHPVIHEYGHFLHSTMDKNGNFDRLNGKVIQDPLLKGEISTEISHYAATNYLDFVAETFAKLLNREKIPASLMKLYGKLGGPLI